MRSCTVRVRLGWALTTLVLAIAGPASADDPKQEAKARYTTAQSHYNLNEFQEALQDFKEAYRLFPDAVFLFNGAQCERQLGNLDEAIKFYRSYLRNKPKAPNRQEVVRRIDEMQSAIDAKKAAAEKPSLKLLPPAAVDEPRASVPPVAATVPLLAPNTPQTVTTPSLPTPATAPMPPLPVLPAGPYAGRHRQHAGRLDGRHLLQRLHRRRNALRRRCHRGQRLLGLHPIHAQRLSDRPSLVLFSHGPAAARHQAPTAARAPRFRDRLGIRSPDDLVNGNLLAPVDLWLTAAFTATSASGQGPAGPRRRAWVMSRARTGAVRAPWPTACTATPTSRAVPTGLRTPRIPSPATEPTYICCAPNPNPLSGSSRLIRGHEVHRTVDV